MRLACTAAPWPTPTDLVNAPELATLAVLDHALEVLGRLLTSVHPELLGTDPIDDDAYGRLSAAALVADQLLILADRMLRAIHDYRVAVTPMRNSIVPDDDGFPF